MNMFNTEYRGVSKFKLVACLVVLMGYGTNELAPAVSNDHQYFKILSLYEEIERDYIRIEESAARLYISSSIISTYIKMIDDGTMSFYPEYPAEIDSLKEELEVQLKKNEDRYSAEGGTLTDKKLDDINSDLSRQIDSCDEIIASGYVSKAKESLEKKLSEITDKYHSAQITKDITAKQLKRLEILYIEKKRKGEEEKRLQEENERLKEEIKKVEEEEKRLQEESERLKEEIKVKTKDVACQTDKD